MQDESLAHAYAQCLEQAHAHYENFPTASRLFGRAHRQATAAIYRFARTADDIADEGSLSDPQRLDGLAYLQQGLKKLEHPADPLFIALADTIHTYQLPVIPFERLLKAFCMDVTVHRFRHFADIQYYCDHSANPVGELILRLHSKYNEQTRPLSDLICTALQLINFIQDIDSDLQQRDRIYLPQDEMQAFVVSEDDLKQRRDTSAVKALITLQLSRAQAMLLKGAALETLLSGRLRWVIRLTVLSGLRVCEKLARRHSTFDRPVLCRHDWLLILARAVYFRYYVRHASQKISTLSELDPQQP